MQDPRMHEGGFSLVSMLIAVGLTGIVAVSLSKLFSNSIKSAKHIEIRDERTHIRQKVLKQFDCQRTLGVSPATALPIACPSSVTPLDKNGRPLFRSDGQVGSSSWHVNSTCSNGGISFTSQRKTGVNNQKQAAEDPLTKKLSVPGPLFKSGNRFCTEYFTNVTGNSCQDEEYVTGIRADGTVVCSQLGLANFTCPEGSYAVAFDGKGKPTCRSPQMKFKGTYHCEGNTCRKYSASDYCALANAESTSPGDRSGGFDCQVFGGPGRWELFSSFRGLSYGSVICSMSCFDLVWN